MKNKNIHSKYLYLILTGIIIAILIWLNYFIKFNRQDSERKRLDLLECKNYVKNNAETFSCDDFIEDNTGPIKGFKCINEKKIKKTGYIESDELAKCMENKGW
ncbi:MAG: hypothetical protein WCT51_03615 [Candidatus Shapirobacteria bacterium]|jgi:hypothetical protein